MPVLLLAALTCLAQDHQFSYEGRNAADALRACRRASDEPKACYLHRCAQESAPKQRVKPLTPDEMRSINDAILQQRCIAGGSCDAAFEMRRRHRGTPKLRLESSGF